MASCKRWHGGEWLGLAFGLCAIGAILYGIGVVFDDHIRTIAEKQIDLAHRRINELESDVARNKYLFAPKQHTHEVGEAINETPISGTKEESSGGFTITLCDD